jgi:hypothetical protein
MCAAQLFGAMDVSSVAVQALELGVVGAASSASTPTLPASLISGAA